MELHEDLALTQGRGLLVPRQDSDGTGLLSVRILRGLQIHQQTTLTQSTALAEVVPELTERHRLAPGSGNLCIRMRLDRWPDLEV